MILPNPTQNRVLKESEVSSSIYSKVSLVCLQVLLSVIVLKYCVVMKPISALALREEDWRGTEDDRPRNDQH